VYAGRAGWSLACLVFSGRDRPGRKGFKGGGMLGAGGCGARGIVAAFVGSSSGLVLGSKSGASDARLGATPDDVRRMKLLVRRHVATIGYGLVSYGIQEVRGSNPRSSTFPVYWY